MLRTKPKQHRTLKPKRVEHVVAASVANAAALLCESIQTSTSLLSAIQEPNIKEKLIQKHNKNIDTNFGANQQQQKQQQQQFKKTTKISPQFNSVIKKSPQTPLRHTAGVASKFFDGRSVSRSSNSVHLLTVQYNCVAALTSVLR